MPDTVESLGCTHGWNPARPGRSPSAVFLCRSTRQECGEDR